MKIYIDGTLHDEADAKVSVFDHGLLYGDGIFEGIRFYNGRVFKLKEHLERLEHSARAILLEIPLDRKAMTEAVLKTIAANGLRDGYVRLIVTRGVGNLGLSPFNCKTPSVIIIAGTIELYPEKLYQSGLDVITCATRRVSPAALDPSIKSLNYLNNVLAKIEAIRSQAGEGLMLNEQGYVAECTGDNIFIVTRGVIKTPPVSAGALRGITRGVVFDLAKAIGQPVEEQMLTRYDILTADECFLTGTAAEIIPVARLDSMPIGKEVPGTITRSLMERFRTLTQTEGTPIP